MEYLDGDGNEVVIGIVGAIGIDHSHVINALKNRFSFYQYDVSEIRLSKSIAKLKTQEPPVGKFDRSEYLINAGNELRKEYNDPSILALEAVREIYEKRKESGEMSLSTEGVSVTIPRRVNIISSLKRPEEVQALRNIYPKGFYLIGVYSSPERRKKSLVEDGHAMTQEQAEILLSKDEDEYSKEKFGQKTRNTFHLADFFVEEAADSDFFRAQINRTVDLIFGAPYETPTFDEYAMYHAFSASLRSADLSRQVGAIIAKNFEIISSGANDCPKPGGGLYWCKYDPGRKEFCDEPEGRDYVKGFDMNTKERTSIFNKVVDRLNIENSDSGYRDKIIDALERSGLKDITEYGRMVHAEMEALLCCARNTIDCRNAVMYGTTFPCHNCAKHIIAAGIKEVVYVEPYPKSKTLEFYGKSIDSGEEMSFRPFIGVGARQFLNLFSMNMGAGRQIKRKNSEGDVLNHAPDTMRPRVAIQPYSFLDVEESVAQAFAAWQTRKNEKPKTSSPE